MKKRFSLIAGAVLLLSMPALAQGPVPTTVLAEFCTSTN